MNLPPVNTSATTASALLAVTLGLGAAAVAWGRWTTGRTARRHEDFRRRCELHGWQVDLDDLGLTISGRSMSRRWHLIAETASGSGSVTFTLGSPDPEQALALVRARRAIGHARQDAPRFLSAVAVQPVGSDVLRRSYAVHARDSQEAARLLSPAIERLLIDWPARTGHGSDGTLRIWISPLGVRVSTSNGFTDWPRLRHMIRIGLALGRRAGFA